jgi:hypothetical protein
MKRQIIQSGIIIIIFAMALSACRKEKGESNEEELITTMIVTATPQGGGTPLEFRFEDLDGPGGDNATQDNIVLAANKTYDVAITLLNETVNPAEDITEEVEEEGDAHRLYYEPAAGSNITASDLDTDGAGVPLGITSTWTTTSAATGSITITLRHYPGNPPDKQIPDPVNSPKSSTDITVTFITTVN